MNYEEKYKKPINTIVYILLSIFFCLEELFEPELRHGNLENIGISFPKRKKSFSQTASPIVRENHGKLPPTLICLIF